MLLLPNPEITRIIAFLLTERVRSGIFFARIPPPTRLVSTPEGEKLDSRAPSMRSLHEFRRLKKRWEVLKNLKIENVHRMICVSSSSKQLQKLQQIIFKWPPLSIDRCCKKTVSIDTIHLDTPKRKSSINTIEDGLRPFWGHRGRVIAHTSKIQHESSTVNEEAHT
jgi:hypothetical protein